MKKDETVVEEQLTNEKINAIGKGFNLTSGDARELYHFSQNIKPEAPKKTTTTKKASKTTDAELEQWRAIIKADFSDVEITNKLIAPRMAVELGLTARQTPSRLTKLEAEGFLTYIEGTKPKAYRLAE